MPRFSWRRFLSLFVATLVVIALGLPALSQQFPTLPPAQQWLRSAWAYQDAGDYPQAEQAIAQSLELLQAAGGPAALLAQALDTQAHLHQAQGRGPAAIAAWKQAEQLYRQLNDAEGVLGSQLNQIDAQLRTQGAYNLACEQVLQTLGLSQYSCGDVADPNRLSEAQFTQLLDDLEPRLPPNLQAASFYYWGLALQARDALPRSQVLLTRSLAIATRQGAIAHQMAAHLQLGNLEGLLSNRETAQEHYQAAIQLGQGATASPPIEAALLQARLNQLDILQQLEEPSEFAPLVAAIAAQLAAQPPGQTLYGRLSFVRQLLAWPETPYRDLAAHHVAIARATAQAHQDPRAQSNVLGWQGRLDELAGHWAAAQQATQQAFDLAVVSQSQELQARWLGQLAQIRQQQGDLEGAIALNQRAVNLLQALTTTLGGDVQFSFRQDVEPIYRNLISLLLKAEPKSEPQQQQYLQRAQQVIEDLQIQELNDFFRQPCVAAKAERLDEVAARDNQTAVLYPIVLPDRLEIIVSLPTATGDPAAAKQGPGAPPAASYRLEHYSQPLNREQVTQTLRRFRRSFNLAVSPGRNQALAQEIYDWVIRPAEARYFQPQGATGAKQPIRTLVFVLDGPFRNVPMAALHDGEQYLVERYSLALTPGLQLVEPRALQEYQFSALTGGLSQGRHGYSGLPAVEAEVAAIHQTMPSHIYLNEDFTHSLLAQRIQSLPAPAIHLATHGQFSSRREDTYLLTWDGPMDVEALAAILRQRELVNDVPLELLVLSACQTASGDERAALGLAGFAVRSGARSTLASLWSVNDASTSELMVSFYQQLQGRTLSRAEALRQAQLRLLQEPRYSHPYFWAAFVLVGNWL